MLRQIAIRMFGRSRPPVNLANLPRLRYEEPMEKISIQIAHEIKTQGHGNVRNRLEEEAETLAIIDQRLKECRAEFDDEVAAPSFRRVQAGYGLNGFKKKERKQLSDKVSDLQEVRDGLKARQMEGARQLGSSSSLDDFFRLFARTDDRAPNMMPTSSNKPSTPS